MIIYFAVNILGKHYFLKIDFTKSTLAFKYWMRPIEFFNVEGFGIVISIGQTVQRINKLWRNK